MEIFPRYWPFVRGIRHRWIPLTMASDAKFDGFFDRRLNKQLTNNQDAGDLRRHCPHYDVTVMWQHLKILLPDGP